MTVSPAASLAKQGNLVVSASGIAGCSSTSKGVSLWQNGSRSAWKGSV